MKILHIFPFTLDIFNFSESDWPTVDDALNYSLSKMNSKGDCVSEIHIYSHQKKQRFEKANDIVFGFHPVSIRRFSSKHKTYLNQTSAAFMNYSISAKADIVHIHASSGQGVFELCNFLVSNNIKYITHYHGGNIAPSSESEAKQRTYIFSRALSICAGVNIHKIAISKIYNVPQDKIFIVPYGADVDNFKPREELKTNEYPALLFVGRINRDKNILKLIETVHLIRDRFESASLTIVGPIEDKAYFSEIETYIDTHNLGHNVHMPGFVPKQDLPNIYSASDLFVFPSKAEAFGRVVVEAMASGVPVVALAGSGGPDEIIENDVDGKLTTLEDFENTVLKMLNVRDSLEQMGIKAREKAVQRFSYGATLESLKYLYASIADRLA